MTRNADPAENLSRVDRRPCSSAITPHLGNATRRVLRDSANRRPAASRGPLIQTPDHGASAGRLDPDCVWNASVGKLMAMKNCHRFCRTGCHSKASAGALRALTAGHRWSSRADGPAGEIVQAATPIEDGCEGDGVAAVAKADLPVIDGRHAADTLERIRDESRGVPAWSSAAFRYLAMSTTPSRRKAMPASPRLGPRCTRPR